MKIIITTLLAATVLLASCHQYEKTKSGLVYKITSGGNKTTLKQGQFIKMNIEYKLGAKDSILNSTYGHIPAFMMIDTARMGKYNFTEVITQCALGDKLQFVMSIDTLKKLGMIPEYNNIFTKNDVIKGRLEVLKVYNNEAEVNADYQKEIESEKQKEVADLDKYLTNKKVKAQRTASGVFVEIQNPGSTPKADTGKQVSVYYTGYLLKNGSLVAKPFDTNVGKDAVHKDVFKVVLGSHSVIPGWEEGLKMLGKGGKGKLYIPAMMAYGMQGQPPAIPPYSNLVFNVEVTDIVIPAPQAAASAMPPMRQMPGQK